MPKRELLTEEFLMYELQALQACKVGSSVGFDPDVLVPTEHRQFDWYGAIVEMLQLRAFSCLSWKIADPTILDRSGDSPLAILALLEQGKVISAIQNRILKFGATPTALSALSFRHREKLKELYNLVSDPQFAKLILQIFPFVWADVPADAIFALLEVAIISPNPENAEAAQVDGLFSALCRKENAVEFDEKIEKRLREKPDYERSKIFFNAFSAMQNAAEAKLFRTAASIAHAVHLYRDAVDAANKVSKHLAQHYIHRSPRSIRAELCKLVDIELVQEDGQAVRIATKDTLLRELATINQERKKLEEQSVESAQFLKELEEWGNREAPPQTHCGKCRKKMAGATAYKFPCGHLFHERCLTELVMTLLSQEELGVLKGILAERKPKAAQIAIKDKMIGSDCPVCGQRATQKIRRSIVPIESCQWALELPQPFGQAKKGKL
jgi:hypothetical protein